MMLIGGLEKSTLIDYPGKVAAIVFTVGCNFRCAFCHNPELVDPEKIKKQPQITEEAFFKFLKSRKGLLEGVCITGGEPTIQSDLIDFIGKIKKDGFLVKLDTNGSHPKVLAKLLEKRLLDFIAMDIKSSKDKYPEAINKVINLEDISKSVDLIRSSSLDYEFRTTVVPDLIDDNEIKKIGEWLKGSKLFILQQFRSNKTLDQSYQRVRPYPDKRLKQMADIARPYFDQVKIRGL